MEIYVLLDLAGEMVLCAATREERCNEEMARYSAKAQKQFVVQAVRMFKDNE